MKTENSDLPEILSKICRKVKIILPNLNDVFSTLFEAAIALFFIHTPLLLLLVWQLMSENGDVSASEQVISIFNASYGPGDVMSYTAGLLASSTAFFVINFQFAKLKPGVVIGLIVAPIFVLFFSAPLYFKGLLGGPENNSFASNFAFYLVLSAFLVWIVSLYQQKAIGHLDF